VIFGMSTFAFVHTLISLAAIVAGIFVVAALLNSKIQEGWTLSFLGLTILTCLTGFALPAGQILPSHIVGILTLIAATLAILARFRGNLSGHSRWLYAVGILISLYFNVFVLVVQSFLKLPALHALAPTQGEPPFAIAQAIVLLVFVIVGFSALRRFHPEHSMTIGKLASGR
jgi:hypothetical protein